MRRGSLVGPLLLIGIGGLFLARNIMPDLPLIDYLAQYWPFLLILWGGLRLIEIAVWAMRDKPLPRYGVSGGEWLLVVLLCMFGLSLHAVRGFTTWLPRAGFEWGGLEVFGESFDYPVEARSAASPPNPRVVVEGFRGSARIVGADTTEVKVSGRTTVRSMDRSTADRLAQDAAVELVAEGGQIVVRMKDGAFSGRNRGPFQGRARADLEIAVPKGAAIVATGRDGDFDISAVTGLVDIHGSNSSVRLESIGGDVRIDVEGSSIVRAVNVKGAFELKGNGSDVDLEKIEGQVSVDGSWGGLIQARGLAKPMRWKGPQTEFTLQALPGDLRMTLGDLSLTQATGPFRMQSMYPRDIEITDLKGSLNLDLQRGDVRIHSGVAPGEMNVRLNAGNVDVSLPENAKFNVNATTDRGDAFSDFGSPFRQESNGRRGAGITGSNGGPNIEVRVNRGDITLRRGGTVSASPAALPSVSRPPAGSPPRAIDQ